MKTKGWALVLRQGLYEEEDTYCCVYAEEEVARTELAELEAEWSRVRDIYKESAEYVHRED